MTDVLTDQAQPAHAPPAGSRGFAHDFRTVVRDSERRLKGWTRRHSLRLWIAALVLLLLLLFFWKDIFIPIGPGREGVLWSRFFGGTVMNRTYGEGYRVILPWDKMTVYNVRLQEMHGAMEVLTIDGLQVSLDVTARFSPRKSDLPELQRRVGPGYRHTVVWPDVVTAVRHVIRQMKPEELRILSEADLAARIDTAARQAVRGHWVDLDRVLITRITLPDTVEHAIQDKLAQEQKALGYRFLIDQASMERQRRLIEADGIREFEAHSHVPFLKWRAIEATERLADSTNTKIVVMGASGSTLPVLLNADK